MKTTLFKKTMLIILTVFAGYLGFGYLLHLVIFPEKKPAVETYFKPGITFGSKAEGFQQKVIKQENGHVYCMLEIGPYADGPPKHIHTDFDETFEIANGELTLWVDGEVRKLRPGEKIFIPRGVPHKPYNETGETIITKNAFPFPEKFAYNLPQVYGVMDHVPGFGKTPETGLQMALFNAAGFDSYVAGGPPVAVQKLLSFILTPAIRLMGYKSFYPQYDIHHRAHQLTEKNQVNPSVANHFR